MGDAAQGEPIQHEVFSTPFKVEPKYEMWETPANYRRYPGGNELPAQIKVWRIQNTGKEFGGVVSAPDSFDGFPDAELLTPGFNVGKQSGAMGVGRHGNYLQWGFSASPAQMTAAGRNFFLNCIWYIRKFDGKRPLVSLRTPARASALATISFMKAVKDPKFGRSSFPAELITRFKDDPDALAQHYKENLELVYFDKQYIIDDDLRSLGLSTNRKLESLEKLVGLTKDPAKSAAALRLLKRYTPESFESAEQWQKWLDANRGRIFFTDVGGYKFLVVPEGYVNPLKAADRR